MSAAPSTKPSANGGSASRVERPEGRPERAVSPGPLRRERPEGSRADLRAVPADGNAAAAEAEYRERVRWFVDADSRGNSQTHYQDDFAQLFAEWVSGRLVYLGGQWAAWNGIRWELGAEDVWPAELWSEFRRTRLRFKRLVQKGEATETQLVEVSGATTMATSVLRAARPYLNADRSRFDAKPYELNTPGGILDLAKAELLPHDSTHYHSRVAAVTPAWPAEGRPRPGRFLDLIASATAHPDGTVDSDYANFLVQVLALCLLGKPGGQFMWVLYGSGGNSKGVVMEVVERLLDIGGSSGTGYAITDEGTFLTATRNAKHESEVAELHGARMLSLSELPNVARWNATRMKTLTGGETLRASFKGKDQFSFQPSATVFIKTNTIPAFDERNNAVERRLRVLPFDTRYTGRADDDFACKLVQDEGPEILAFLAERAREFLKRGGVLPEPPERVREASAATLDETDLFGQFLEQCLVDEPGTHTLNSEVRKAFEAFLDREGIDRADRPKDKLMTRLRNDGFITDHKVRDKKTGKTGPRYVKDVRLVCPAESGETLAWPKSEARRE